MLERRTNYRAKVALPGAAAFAKLADEVPCVVLSHSDRGACIAFAPGTEMPRMFELRIGRAAEMQTARVVWRRTNTVGVAFLTPGGGVPDPVHG